MNSVNQQWAQQHLDAAVQIRGDVWRIIGATTSGETVLLRRADDACSRIESTERVRRIYAANTAAD